MKKIVSFLLILSMMISAFTVFSVSAADYKSSKIAVNVTAPVTNASPVSVTSSDVVLQYQTSDDTLKTVNALDYRVHTSWKCDKVPFAGKFEKGKDYTVEITITFDEGIFSYILNQTVVTVNGKTADVFDADENQVVVTYTFKASSSSESSADLTIEASGKTEKTYDGESVTLTAKIANKSSSARYYYSWEKDGVAINTNGDNVQVKNASDSGKYKCTVSSNETDTKFTAETTVKITKRKITVEIFDATKAEGEKDPDFEYTVIGGLIENEPIIGVPSRTAGEKIGSYRIEKGSLEFDPEYAQNYELTVQEGTLTITDPSLKYSDASSITGDDSHISGENDSKIKIEANIDSVPSGAMFSISRVSDVQKDTIESLIKDNEEANILKMFTVKLIASNNQELSLKSGTAIRIRVPLTEAEKAIKNDISIVYYNTKSGRLVRQKAEVKMNSDAAYLVFDTANTGAFILVSDKKPADFKDTDGAGEANENDKEEKKSEWWIWAIVIVVCAGAIIVSVVCLFILKPMKAELKNAGELDDKSDKVKIFKNSDSAEKEDKPEEKENKISFDDLEDQ